MIVRSFSISLKEDYRFLIATSYFAYLDSLGAENLITVLVRRYRQYIISLKSLTLALKTLFSGLKRRRRRFKTAIFSCLLERVFKPNRFQNA